MFNCSLNVPTITVDCPPKYKITDNSQTNYTNMILVSVFYVIKYNRIIQVFLRLNQ